MLVELDYSKNWNVCLCIYAPRQVRTELFESVHCCYLDAVWINVSNVKISPNQSSALHTLIQCECGVLFLNQTPANLGFPGSLQTRFLARPYHCAVIHPEGSEMRLGVLGTRLRMPGSDPRFWSWRAAIFATKEEIPRHDKLGCQSEAQYSVWTWIIDQDQGRRQSPVSWRVWRQSVSSSLVTAVTRVAGQAACVSQWMFPGNHLLTISHWLYWASCHLSFTASCATSVRTNLHVLAKSNCDPDTGLRDETRTLSRSEGDHGLETPGLSWPGHCLQECLILSSRRTGFLSPLSRIFLLTSDNEGWQMLRGWLR